LIAGVDHVAGSLFLSRQPRYCAVRSSSHHALGGPGELASSFRIASLSHTDAKESPSRHDDAIVVRDPQTQQLILRGAVQPYHDCPTCHRPFRSASPDRNTSPHRTGPFISRDYFRLLQAANGGSDEQIPPSSPIRRLVEPAFPSDGSSLEGSVSGAEFVTSTPAPQTGQGIKKEAFSPNYFNKFFVVEKELGRGGKGVVLLVRHELDGVSLGMMPVCL
jgi:hypothetical protein